LGERKLFLNLGGRPLISWSLETFLGMSDLGDVVVVVHHEDRIRSEEILLENGDIGERVRIVTGGSERQDSVYEGLKNLGNHGDIIIVHDGARPFVTLNTIHSAVGKVNREGVGVIAATPVKDTIKRVVNGKIVETLPRKLIWSVQTPQVFPAEMLMRAYEIAMKDGFYSNDDAALCERLGYPVEVIEGDPENIKITTPDDLRQAELIMRSRDVQGES
jgi:2-C-methyl-D-erythritol 4-phosphate cytidylyltransferase